MKSAIVFLSILGDFGGGPAGEGESPVSIRAPSLPVLEPSPAVAVALIDWQFPVEAPMNLSVHPLQRRMVADPTLAALHPAFYPNTSEESEGARVGQALIPL